MEIKTITNHFNWIELTMKFWKEDIEMPLSLDLLLKEWLLMTEVILIAEKSNHTTVIIVTGTNWGTTCEHIPQNKPLLLKGLF